MVLSMPTSGAGTQTAVASGTKASKTAGAAREFEAILLQDWLEKMNETFVGVEKSNDPAQGTWNSLATQTIATAVANRGGIGIANLLLKHLNSSAKPDAAADLPSELPPATRVAPPGQLKREP